MPKKVSISDWQKVRQMTVWEVIQGAVGLSIANLPTRYFSDESNIMPMVIIRTIEQAGERLRTAKPKDRVDRLYLAALLEVAELAITLLNARVAEHKKGD